MNNKAGVFALASVLIAVPAYAAFDDAGTDYSAQTTESWTWTPGLQPMETANQILCFVRGLRAGEMVNQGLYTALVNQSACETGNQDGNASRGPQNMTAGVESTRTDADSPQQVRVWIPEMGSHGGLQQIRALAEVRQSPTKANPAGDFTMAYQMYNAANVGAGIIGEGQLEAIPRGDGTIALSFYETGGFGESAATIEKTGDGSQGTAITQSDFDGQNTRRYHLSWSSNRVLIEKPDGQGGTEEVCLARGETEERVYRYGLYDVANGDRVDIQGGFPFQFTEGNKTHQGFLGYWGSGWKTRSSSRMA